MIYTCYEMIRDCRAGNPEGWRYFAATYVPVIRRLLGRYQPGQAVDNAIVESLLRAVHRRESALFQSMEPAPERWFVAELRQKVVEQLPAGESTGGIDLETVAAALEPLTLVEKQCAWLETMRYTSAEAGSMLRMAPATVEKIRGKAGELLRGKADSWSRDILGASGRALQTAATAAKTGECLPPKPFLDMLDGRSTWRGREELEQHVLGCWHCIDHFCRLLEVIDLLRDNHPLTAGEAAPYWELLGVTPPPRPAWKRWVGR